MLGLDGDLLCDRVDMAAQAYQQGHHLLCHDDVIGTRVVTFVLFLTGTSFLGEETTFLFFRQNRKMATVSEVKDKRIRFAKTTREEPFYR